MDAQQSITAFRLRITEQRREGLHVGLRPPLVAASAAPVGLKPRDGPLLPPRRELPVGRADVPLPGRVDVVQRGEDDVLREHLVEANVEVAEPHPPVAAPAADDHPQVRAQPLHDAVGDTDPCRHPGRLGDAVVVTEVLEGRPVALDDEVERRVGRGGLRATAHALRLPEPHVVQHRVGREHVSDSRLGLQPEGGVGRVAVELKAQARPHAPVVGVLQALRQDALGADDGVVGLRGKGDDVAWRDVVGRLRGLRRRAGAEHRVREQTARAEAEVLCPQVADRAPPVRERRRRRGAHSPCALPRVGAERLMVVGVEAHEVHLLLGHLVEEEPVVLQIPGGRRVQEVVPGQAAPHTEDRRPALIEVVGHEQALARRRERVAAQVEPDPELLQQRVRSVLDRHPRAAVDRDGRGGRPQRVLLLAEVRVAREPHKRPGGLLRRCSDRRRLPGEKSEVPGDLPRGEDLKRRRVGLDHDGCAGEVYGGGLRRHDQQSGQNAERYGAVHCVIAYQVNP